MFFLLASMACSVAVSALLKLARRHRLHVGQAIAANYPTAALLCLLLLRPHPAALLQPGTPWWALAALGLLLPAVFLAMAGAVRHAGIVVSDAAQRLSLLIPLLAAFTLFGETASPGKLAGIAIALAALACLLWRPPAGANDAEASVGKSDCAAQGRMAAHGPAAEKAPAQSGLLPKNLMREDGRTRAAALLACVWLGYGAIDVLFKQLARAADFSSGLFAAFGLSALVIGAWLAARRTAWNRRSLAAGVLLGGLNFGNIYFYLRAHQAYPDNPALVFAAMNIGVIALGTLAGAGVFRERLSRANAAGLLLAAAAIVALMPR